jgi:glutathione peroxidase
VSTLQDFSVAALDGAGDLIPDLDGKVVLVVNVASRCGLTPQYAGLEALYRQLGGDDFVVVGFPCNQFGGQEPGTPAEIASFCQTNYDVSFPLTQKVEVNGPGRHPIYAWLTGDDDGFPGDIEWNFEKFLIDREGRIYRRYPPATKPDDKGLLADIAELL